MSGEMASDDSDKLLRLLSLKADELLNDEQWEELVALVSSSTQARRIYVEHMFLQAMMHRMARLTKASTALPEPLGPDVAAPREEPDRATGPARSPILGFLGDVFQAGTNFLARPPVLTLLLAVGLPGILFLILVLHVARQPAPVVPVAQLTQTHQCVWDKGDKPLPVGKDLFAGEQLRLSEGLVEITFDKGAKVLLKGPATFDASSNGQGFLHAGSLVANVPKGSEGFTVRTPNATVIDLGTEFGVFVEDEKGIAEVQVFQGNVELQTAAQGKPQKTSCQRVQAGGAVRITLVGQKGASPVISKITPPVNRFVRRMPSTPVEAIVADFSGGEGNTQVDQFPGVAGSGWATGWSVGEAKELKCVTSIEQDNPLLGGGKYLRVLVERESGGAHASTATAVERRLALTNGVDLTKPHVVSLNLRIDVLNRFTEAGDWLSICSRSIPHTELGHGWPASSGWHICVVGKGSKRAKSGNWAFLQRNKKGHVTDVNSGIPAREGNTYSFRILVDPPARQWTPSIAVNGGKWTTFKPMEMRSKGTAKKNKYWPFLHLYWRMEGGNKGEDVEKTGFSVDSIRITPG